MDFEQVHFKRSSSFDETFRLYKFFLLKRIHKVILIVLQFCNIILDNSLNKPKGNFINNFKYYTLT